MSYNGPPPPYSEAAAVPKPNTGMIPGHVLATPLGPIQPHLEQMKPSPGEFGNPYAQPKGRRTPPTSDSYSSDVKVPYSETSQLESGPYPSGTLTYSRNVGSGSYQSPPNSNIVSGAPPGYQAMPSPRMPSAPNGGGVNHGGIYPSVGYAQPPYPTDTFERGVNQPGGPQGYAMPRPSQPNYTRSSSPPLAGRIDQMNISGSPNNYPPGQRPYSPYSQNPGYPPNIGGGASYQSPPNSMVRLLDIQLHQ
uniref:Uncharacterized protein n=1 Tax=Panagrolaimus davidi TaxID=227884 RepID=A0A914PJM4_9BILA